MSDPKQEKPARSPDADIDPAWQAEPASAPRPSPVPREILPSAAAASGSPPPSPAPQGVPPPPGAASGSPLTFMARALLFAAFAGGALAWRLTAPSRGFRRGLALLERAKRDGDPKAAGAALRLIEPYVDSTGRGYDWLFEAAVLADDAAGAAYEERLMKTVPESGPALLVWYESALFYHVASVKRELELLDASGPSARPGIVEKILAHCDAAAALKPIRAKAVAAFDGDSLPPRDAALLLRIDAMQRQLGDVGAAERGASAAAP